MSYTLLLCMLLVIMFMENLKCSTQVLPHAHLNGVPTNDTGVIFLKGSRNQSFPCTKYVLYCELTPLSLLFLLCSLQHVKIHKHPSIMWFSPLFTEQSLVRDDPTLPHSFGTLPGNLKESECPASLLFTRLPSKDIGKPIVLFFKIGRLFCFLPGTLYVKMMTRVFVCLFLFF